MSDPGPPHGGGDDPFGGLPFFGDVMRMLQQQGPVSWDAARQLAMSIATGGQSESNVEPLERIRVEQLARVADLRVADATGLSTSITGRTVTIVPVTRAQWVQRSVDAYRPLFEQLAGSLAHGGEGEGGPTNVTPFGVPGMPGFGAVARSDRDPDDAEMEEAMSAWMGGIIQMLAPMMLGMTAGSMLGHLARRSFGQYDLPLPRPVSDELLLVTANIKEFGRGWSLDDDDLLLWVCLHEVAHHAVLGVPHVRHRLDDLLRRYTEGFQPDPRAFEERLSEFEVGDPSSLAGIQQVLGDPEVLLGAMQSHAQREMLPQLEALVAVIVGYVDHVMDSVGGQLIGSYSRVTEALRRRRVEADASDRFVERLLGLGLTQSQYDRGATFVNGVVERAGKDGLDRIWQSERELPTPAEVDAPGLWLARIDLPN